VKLYDKIEKEALEMADMITKAIVQQFPQVFQ
ncbi:acetylglutamate kinase, partial [Bacillus paranthracis]|nr:acetylglutamate kinase [Bacillus paranthracis]